MNGTICAHKNWVSNTIAGGGGYVAMKQKNKLNLTSITKINDLNNALN